MAKVMVRRKKKDEKKMRFLSPEGRNYTTEMRPVNL